MRIAVENPMAQFGIQSILENQNNPRDQRYIRGSSAGYCSRKIGYSLLGYMPTPVDGHSQFTFDLGQHIHDMMQLKLVRMGWIKAEPFWNAGKGILDWKQLDDPMSGCELDVVDHTNRILGHLDGITVPLIKVPGTKDPIYMVAQDNPDAERYIIEIKSISDRSSFWIKGYRNGDKTTLDGNSMEEEFIEIDAEVQKSGKLQARISRYQYERNVRTAYGNRTFPVYKLRIDGKDELVTITMMGHSMGQFQAITKPKPEHIAQASLYAAHYGIKKILFLYVGKDVDRHTYTADNALVNWPIKIFEHEVKSADLMCLYDKFAAIYDRTDKGLLPDRDFDDPNDSKAECGFCPYRWTCWPDKTDITDLHKNMIMIGLTPMTDGPSVMHLPTSGSLETEFTESRPE